MRRLLHSQIGFFFTLSAAFWGLLGSLLVLWGGFSILLTDSLREAIPRLETFALLSVNSLNGTAVFPDSTWALATAEHPCSAALILAFMHAFLAGGVPVIILWFGGRNKGACDGWARATCPYILMALWGVLLAVFAYRGSGSWVESAMWFLAALAPWPLYRFINRLRPAFLRELSPRDSLKGILFLGVMALISFLGLSASLSLPRGEGTLFPLATSAEAMLVVRDEVLPLLPGGPDLSDGYYNNVVAANYFLRPPVSARWIDVTAGLCGLESSWGESCSVTGIVACDIAPTDLMKVLSEGLRRTDGSTTGPGGLEIVLVGAGAVAEDFWQQVAALAPAMLDRIVVVDGVTLVNERLAKGFAHYEEGSKRDPAKGWHVRDLLEKSLVAVQVVTDKTSFRDAANGWGLGLIKGIGLPMLSLWILVGVGVLLGGSVVLANNFSGTPGGILTGILWLAIIALGAREIFVGEAPWQQERARACWHYETLNELAARQPGDPRDEAHLAQVRVFFEKHWHNDWLKKFADLDKFDATARSRAWAALSRVLETGHLLMEEEKRRGRSPLPKEAPVLWAALAQGALLEGVADPDPVVAYWALKVAIFVDPAAKEFWFQVARRLKDPHLNVRDRAVEALAARGHPALLELLRDHYRETPEPCAYVKLNGFKYLFEFRRR